MLSLPNALLRRLTTFLGALLVLHAPALATWSIVVLNHKTGEVCVATATCIPNFQIRRYVPVVRVGLGGAAAQSWVDSQAYNRGLIWDALEAMAYQGSRHIRVGDQSMRLPNAMVWIVADEQPMRQAMYGYARRILVLSIIIALFTAFLLYLALRWLVIQPLQALSADMVAFRRAPEGGEVERPPSGRRDEIGIVDREFRTLLAQVARGLGK